MFVVCYVSCLVFFFDASCLRSPPLNTRFADASSATATSVEHPFPSQTLPVSNLACNLTALVGKKCPARCPAILNPHGHCSHEPPFEIPSSPPCRAAAQPSPAGHESPSPTTGATTIHPFPNHRSFFLTQPSALGTFQPDGLQKTWNTILRGPCLDLFLSRWRTVPLSLLRVLLRIPAGSHQTFNAWAL